jgi:hypothetical protein
MSFTIIQSRFLRRFREENLKKNFDEDSKKTAIYTANTSKPALPTKYSEYADVFSENKINNISSITRIEHAIDFEENSIIFYKFIYHFSERKLTILK